MLTADIYNLSKESKRSKLLGSFSRGLLVKYRDFIDFKRPKESGKLISLLDLMSNFYKFFKLPKSLERSVILLQFIYKILSDFKYPKL